MKEKLDLLLKEGTEKIKSAKNENEPTPQPEPDQAINADMLSVLVSKFDDLTKAIQINNIRNSENKQVEQTPPEELLASIVKPTRK